jgi:uncharacterized protein involved in propanediol utilization
MNEKLIGYGKSYASFGEIVQGRLSNGEDFLVTIPVDMWSTCELVCEPFDGPSFVKAKLLKSKLVAEQMLKVLDMGIGNQLTIDFTRNIPIGKGLSSSTADMLAVVRAFQEVFGIIVTESFISRLFAAIEPHDGLHYYMSVIYNHRQGNLISKLNYIPDYHIIAVDNGGELSTKEYNKKLQFTTDDLSEYDALYNKLLIAFAMRDDNEIAKCAHRSTVRHIKRTGNEFLAKMVEMSLEIDTLGVLATHSGTCGGFLLPSSASEELLESVSTEAAKLGDVFRTKTLRILL